MASRDVQGPEISEAIGSVGFISDISGIPGDSKHRSQRLMSVNFTWVTQGARLVEFCILLQALLTILVASS